MAVVITRGDQVLFGRRPMAGGDYAWQLPGGWIEIGESPPTAARREVYEETRLRLGELDFVAVTNNVFSTQFHSITLYFEAECDDPGPLAPAAGESRTSWEWKRWAEISENLFLPLRLLRQTDYRPFSGRLQGRPRGTCVSF